MASPSVTYSFSNGTTADATQVNQNFTDLINGLTDGTKDLSISALTVAGTGTFNGAVTLGNSSVDDITITGSIAASIPIKTNASFDIGSSTLGLASVYLGSAGPRTTRLVSGATTSYTLTTPTTAGTNLYSLKGNGSASLYWSPPDQASINNFALSASVATNALTIALKGADGNDPSSTNPVAIGFRHTTATTGTPLFVAATAATSVVVSSGSTLGSSDGQPNWVYVYAIDNAGTIELAVSGSRFTDTGSLITTTTEGGGGAADDKYTLYSTTGRTGVPIRLIGRVKSTQTTAGTWATAPSEISLIPFELNSPRSMVRVDTANGRGSSATAIRRFTNTQVNIGPAITYADSSTAGGSFTINEDGIYSITFFEFWNSGVSRVLIALSLNQSDLTQVPNSISVAERLAYMDTNGASSGAAASCSWTGVLKAGDVIRANVQAQNPSTSALCGMTITKVNN